MCFAREPPQKNRSICLLLPLCRCLVAVTGVTQKFMAYSFSTANNPKSKSLLPRCCCFGILLLSHSSYKILKSVELVVVSSLAIAIKAAFVARWRYRRCVACGIDIACCIDVACGRDVACNVSTTCNVYTWGGVFILFSMI